MKRYPELLLGVSLCCVFSSISSAQSDDRQRPNVLFIAVDDLNDWVGHLGGHPNAKTPNIDRLAKRGVSFTRAYCSAPLCNPSRISLLTGVAPSKSGVYGNGERLRDKLPDAVTLMQHFRMSEYTVRGSGKIFHGAKAYDADSWQSTPIRVRQWRTHGSGIASTGSPWIRSAGFPAACCLNAACHGVGL